MNVSNYFDFVGNYRENAIVPNALMVILSVIARNRNDSTMSDYELAIEVKNALGLILWDKDVVLEAAKESLNNKRGDIHPISFNKRKESKDE